MFDYKLDFLNTYKSCLDSYKILVVEVLGIYSFKFCRKTITFIRNKKKRLTQIKINNS